METIPNFDSAWIEAFSPISLEKKKKKSPKLSGKLGAYGSTILFFRKKCEKD